MYVSAQQLELNVSQSDTVGNGVAWAEKTGLYAFTSTVLSAA